MILETGQIYDLDALTLIGWTTGDGHWASGHLLREYFDHCGRYTGPYVGAIEPIFEDMP